MFAVLQLLSSTFYSGLVILGFGTVINKLGRFFIIMEKEDTDNFKKAFDASMSDITEEFNNSFVAINLITSNSLKLLNLSYNLMMGEKYIKKSKDGKIIICDKNKMVGEYESKINSLNNKINKFREKMNEMHGNSDNINLDVLNEIINIDNESSDEEYSEDDDDDDDDDNEYNNSDDEINDSKELNNNKINIDENKDGFNKEEEDEEEEDDDEENNKSKEEIMEKIKNIKRDELEKNQKVKIKKKERKNKIEKTIKRRKKNDSDDGDVEELIINDN